MGVRALHAGRLGSALHWGIGSKVYQHIVPVHCGFCIIIIVHCLLTVNIAAFKLWFGLMVTSTKLVYIELG